MTRLAGEGHRPRGVLRGMQPTLRADGRVVPVEYFARWLVRERGGEWDRMTDEARDAYLEEARLVIAQWERDEVILCQRAASVDRAISQEVD